MTADLPLIRLYEGDSLDVLRTVPDGTYTAVVSDPPYGLSTPPDPLDVLRQWIDTGDFIRKTRKGKTVSGFLGAQWDSFVPGPALWAEVFRVCKPGAIVLVFASTRTQHWMALSLVLAGFEIIDTIGWIQSQSMSHSGSIDKKIDAHLGVERPVIGKHPNPGSTNPRTAMGDGWQEAPDLTAPGSGLAAEWEGWSTQLAPGIEPIIVARKPCEGTATANVIKHGCGAMNIDACRILHPDDPVNTAIWTAPPTGGRWPKHIMFDEASAAILDMLVPESKSGKPRADRGKGGIWKAGNGIPCGPQYGDIGGPSRFFWVGPRATPDDVVLPVKYVPKASKRDRAAGLPDGVAADHPTTKPTSLMEWLCRLVGHERGRILDPFAGSGTTLRAARAMGLQCDGIERDPHYCRDLAAPRSGVDGLTTWKPRTVDELLAADAIAWCCLEISNGTCADMTTAEDATLTAEVVRRLTDAGATQVNVDRARSRVEITASGATAAVQVDRPAYEHAAHPELGILHSVLVVTETSANANDGGSAGALVELAADMPEVTALLLRRGDVLASASDTCKYRAAA